MIMHPLGPALMAMFLLSLTGCLGSLRSSTPPVYFELAYSPESVACADTPPAEVRVWHFSASAPFDREEMVVLGSSRETRFSPQYRWVAVPGVLVSDMLIRDLTVSAMFSRVISMGDPFNAPMQLGGRIFQFGWKESNSYGRAVLDLEISLWREEPQRKILFRKRFLMESEEHPSGNPERLAGAMSEVVKQFSAALQRELCATLKGNSSPNAG